MTMNMKQVKKVLAMGLAAICMTFAFNASTEAAAPHHNTSGHATVANHKAPAHVVVHKDAKHINHAPGHPAKNEASDAIFFRHKVPANHHQCTNPRHAKWAPHFHCTKTHHKHRESWELCRYDNCHDKHPFRHH